MEFLFESRFGALMEGISGQFGTTPLGFALFILIIVSLPLILTLIYRHQTKKARKNERDRSDQIIEKRAAKLNLSPAEKRLVERLADTDGRNGSSYLVLFDEPRFHKVAAELMQGEDAPPASAVAALRVKLGFQREPAKIPHSTAMLPEGATLLVKSDKHGGVQKAEITRIAGEGFEIRLAGTYLLAPGDSAQFQFQNSSGTYVFKSYCIKRDGNLMTIRHQERVKKLQKRRFFRSPYDGGAEIGYYDEDERFPTRFIDLGGGGASLVNPDGRFKENDFLELSFKIDDRSGPFHLRCRVIRTSKSGQRLHLMFEGMKEAVRDKILGTLFKPTARVE